MDTDANCKYKTPYEMFKAIYGDQVVRLEPKRDAKKSRAFEQYLARTRKAFEQSGGGLQTFKQE